MEQKVKGRRTARENGFPLVILTRGDGKGKRKLTGVPSDTVTQPTSQPHVAGSASQALTNHTTHSSSLGRSGMGETA